VAGIVAFFGSSYMFNSMDRRVFPALLSVIIPQYELTLPEAGFVSTAFTVTVAIFGALSGSFMARFGGKAILVGGLFGYSLFAFITPLATGFTTLSIYLMLTQRGRGASNRRCLRVSGRLFRRAPRDLHGRAAGVLRFGRIARTGSRGATVCVVEVSTTLSIS
jgi:MFS transporter, DHA1 family, inner membrane transport protein